MRILRSIVGILAAVMFMLSAVSGLSFASGVVITDESTESDVSNPDDSNTSDPDNDGITLPAPKNVRFDNDGETVIWDAVDGAEWYTLDVSNTVTDMKGNKYTFGLGEWAGIETYCGDEWKYCVMPESEMEHKIYVNACVHTDNGTVLSDDSEPLTVLYAHPFDDKIEMPDKIEWDSDNLELIWNGNPNDTQYWVNTYIDGKCFMCGEVGYMRPHILGGRLEKYVPFETYAIELYVVDKNKKYNKKTCNVECGLLPDDEIQTPEISLNSDELSITSTDEDIICYSWVRVKDKSGVTVSLELCFEQTYSVADYLTDKNYTVDVCDLVYCPDTRSYKISNWSLPLELSKRDTDPDIPNTSGSTSDDISSDTSDGSSSDTSDNTSDNTSEDTSGGASDTTSSDTSDDTSSNTSSDISGDISDDTSSGTSNPDDVIKPDDTSEPNTSDSTEEPVTSTPAESDTSDPTSSEPSISDPNDTSSNTSGDTSDDTSSGTNDDTSDDTSDITSTPTGDGEITKDVQIGDGAPNAEIVTPMGSLLDAVLTAEELEQYKNGADIKVTITSDDISSSVTSADMRAVKNALSGFFGYNVGIYVDMRIFKSVSGRVNSVHDLNSPITVRIEAPENLRKIGREFIVVRVHDGKATVLNDYDENDNTITFRTDKFSTYAIAYKDKAGAVGTVSGGTEGNPYTGGVSNQTKFLIAGCISLFIFVMLCLFTGKNGMTEEEKEQKFSKLIAWGKRGGKVRAAIALIVIFLLLSFYYGIGMKKSAK